MILPGWMAAGKALISGWWRIGLALIAVTLASYQLGHCRGVSHERDRQEAATAKANVAAMRRNADANEDAAAARRTDDSRLNSQEQELKDAREQAETDTDRRRDRGCTIMRQQGRDTSRLAECQ